MAEIRVPVERLREVAGTLQNQQQEVLGFLQRTIMLVDDLYSDWTGLAQVDYAQRFNDEVPPMRGRIEEILQNLSEALRKVANDFEETDRNAVPDTGTGSAQSPNFASTQGPNAGNAKVSDSVDIQEPGASPGNVPSSVDFDSISQEEFIDYVGQWAQLSDKETGVPTSVTIAQAVLETGWGKHTIGEANNLFGIKGEGPAGSVQVPTQEYENGEWVTKMASFAKYHTFEESIVAHANLIANSSYYTEAMKHTSDPKAFAQHLEGVYATDPQYAEKLISIMDQYDLYRFDV